MNALIVYAHPEPTSFTGALKDAVARALQHAGCTRRGLRSPCRRLQSGRRTARLHHRRRSARFHYQTEQGHAFAHNGYAADLVREQQRFQKADLLVVHFPLWWGGMPAILKGWFDRVLAYGFAYADGKRYDSGYFRGRRGILCVTTGGTTERFSPSGVYGPIEQVLYPVHRCMIEYLGHAGARSVHRLRGAARRRRGAAGLSARLGDAPARDRRARRARARVTGGAMPRISGAQRGEGVQAVVFALQILEYLAQHRSTVGVTDLARVFDTTKSRMHRHLQTLVAAGYVMRDDETERYRSGARLIAFGRAVARELRAAPMRRGP